MMTEAEEKVADDLDAAADYLRTFGWCQNIYGGGGGPACMRGAMMQNQNAGPEDEAAIYAVIRVIRSISIASWNDSPGRTADEVIDALMEAAARIRTEEL